MDTGLVVSLVLMLITALVAICTGVMALIRTGKSSGRQDEKVSGLQQQIDGLVCIRDPNFQQERGESMATIEMMNSFLHELSGKFDLLVSRLNDLGTAEDRRALNNQVSNLTTQVARLESKFETILTDIRDRPTTINNNYYSGEENES